jgi:drug/metabolite transporter (DMT)-like permease
VFSKLSNFHQGIALGIVGAFLFSCKAVIIKLAYRHGVDPATLIAWRMILAMPFFAVVAVWIEWDTRRTGGARPAFKRGDWLRIVALGLIGYYLSSYLDFLGLQYISAGLERVILYLNPTIVLMMSVFVLGKKLVPRQIVSLVIAYIGVLLVLWQDVKFSGPNVPLGAGLVFASAMTYAVYLVAGGEMVKRFGPMRLTAWASLVSCVACIVQALILVPDKLLTQAAPVYWLSLLNATVSTVLPVFMLMFAVQKVGSTVASQTGLIGPIATIILAWLFLGETVSSAQLIGTGIVIAGVFVLSRQKA